MERSSDLPLDKSSLPYLRWGKQMRRCVKLDTETNSCLDHRATLSSNVSTDPPPQEKPKKRPRLVHKYSNCKVYSQDDFSKLPDHIITGHILPHLDWKERVRSSVLSRRWKYLWRCSLGTNLVFPYGVSNPVFLGECPASFRCFPKCFCSHEYDILSYKQEVDCITKAFTGPELDQFIVCMEAAPPYHHAIRRWVQFAFRWKVKILNLDLTAKYGGRLVGLIKFPCLKRLSSFGNPKIHAYPPISLKEVSLTYVNTPGETVEYLLSCCPFLELLSLRSSLSSNLKICGSSVKLKHLEIVCCLVPLKVEVSAPNLITLKHDGLRGDLLLNDVPLLADLLMSGTYFDRFVNEFVRRPLEHFNYFFQLETLELIMSSKAVPTSINFPLELPTLVKLEELKVVMHTRSDDVMLWPIVVLKAAPYLQRFFVKQINDLGFSSERFPKREIKIMRGATKFTHSCLKVFEVTGFGGSRVVCEMVERVLFIAAAPLEKVVIKFDERRGWDRRLYRHVVWKNRDIGSRSTTETIKSLLIRGLESIMPTNAKLFVL